MTNLVLALAIYLFGVILPIVLWFFFIKYQDRLRPEPKKVIIKSFITGCGVAILSIISELLFLVPLLLFFGNRLGSDVNQVVGIMGIAVVLLAALVEESLKFFILKKFIFKKEAVDQITDGAVYGITLALGFVLVENTLYFFDVLSLGSQALFFITFLRGLLTVFLHVSTTGYMGYFLGQKKFTGLPKSLWKVWLLVLLVHTLFNISTLFPYGIFAGMVIIALFFGRLLKLMGNKKSLLVWKKVTRKK